MACWAIWSSPARGQNKVRVEATIDPSLHIIHGRIHVEGERTLRLVDAQSQLPIPIRDIDIRRTFPGLPERGWIHTQDLGNGQYQFHTVLPRRMGANGLTPGKGLFVNGGWLPQPTRDGQLLAVDWEVELQVPEQHTVILNGFIGKGTISWQGKSSFLSLAVLRKAHLETIQSDERAVTWVGRRPLPSRRKNRLQASLDLLSDAPPTSPITLIDTPLRRRLTRTGEGMVFLSDRTFRVSGPLWVHHTKPVARALMESGLPISDPWLRHFAATAIADATVDVPTVEERLRFVKWIPEIEALLHDGRLPFYSDILDETRNGDAVQDDLYQVIQGGLDARIIARRTATLHGQSALQQMAWDLSRGAHLNQACTRAGVPVWQITEWPVASNPQDYALKVESSQPGWSLHVTRDAADGTPPEIVEIAIDGDTHIWTTDPGPDAYQMNLAERPKRVRLDPQNLTEQNDRTNDAWPLRSSTTLAFFPYQVNLSQGRISALADILFRPQVHGQTAWRLGLGTSDQNLISSSVSLYHFAGPLQDRRTRPVRSWLGIGASILDPDYRPLPQTTTTIETFGGVTWDTRNDHHFPLGGHRLSLTASGGFAPNSNQWGSIRLAGTKVFSTKGRWAAVTWARAGLAHGEVEHRLLSLGGNQALLSIPPGLAVGNRLVVSAAEFRYQILRGASIPLPTVWLADVNLSLGLEGGHLQSQCTLPTPCSWSALGFRSGLSFVGDVFGVRPSMLGIWFGQPLWISHSMEANTPPMQWVLRLTQPF